MSKLLQLNTTYTWAGATLGPTLPGQKGTVVPDSFPDDLRIPGTEARSLSDEEAESIQREQSGSGAANVVGGDPATSGLRAEFTADEFLASVAARGVAFTPTGSGGRVTLRDVFSALGGGEEDEDKGATTDETPAGVSTDAGPSLAEEFARQNTEAQESAPVDGGNADAATGAGTPSGTAGTPSSGAGTPDSGAGTPSSGAGAPSGTAGA